MLCFHLLLLTAVFAQTAAAGAPAALQSGYSADVTGEILEYNSADPDVRSALLVRSLQREDYIEWETARVPADANGEFVTFIWLFGMDADPEAHHFDLYVNGRRWFQFANPRSAAERRRILEGPHGARLTLRGTFVDRHSDLFGYALLRLPGWAVTAGQPARLKVMGESSGSRIWYMTFRAAVQSSIEVTQQPAVVQQQGRRFHLLTVRIVHLAEPTRATITLPAGDATSTAVDFGGNHLEVLVPEVQQAEEVTLTINLAGKVHLHTVQLRPVRRWQINLVQHTHTDIGYTRPQTEILREHVRYLDTALDYCDLTDHYPDDARFRWTCEGSWAVREFLRTRPAEQVQRFKERVLQGRIEVTAMFMNMSEITDEATYAASLQPLDLFRELGLPVTTAMQNDVNGAPWCLVDMFGDIGIKYLSMGQHGHRALVPFERPTAFWWESPAGRRVLAFRADHYNTGNFWGVHNGVFESVEGEVLRYLAGLEGTGYPFDRITVQHSGYFTDNSPPSTAACAVVARWNRKYIWPRLRIATAREFLEYVEQQHGAALPAYRLAWPDWWTDGTASAARETAAARTTQVDLAATQSLLAMDRLLGAQVPDRLIAETQRISDALLFYGEHTYGAAESIREPLAENSMVQWAEKAAYAWDAVKRTQLLQEAAMGLLQNHLPGSAHPRIVVINTLNWSRSGLLEVYIDHQLLPRGSGARILDSAGRAVAAQPLRSRADGTYWGLWVENVPAFGLRTYTINTDQGPAETLPNPPRTAGLILENAFYRLAVDPECGAISELFDKELGLDLVDAACRWKPGQFIYERLGNRSQLEQFKLEQVDRTVLANVEVKPGAGGPVWQSILITGQTPACHGPAGLKCEVRLYNHGKLIELHYSAMKKQIFEPEGLYIALPFALPGGRILYEAQGGVAAPDADLLPGTASDWQTVQSFAAVNNGAAQIVVSSPEVPLMQFGGLNLGKFQRVARVLHPHMFSWVMNNYWVTNFRAGQQGEFKWRYRLTSFNGGAIPAATRFGWQARVPFLSRVLPPGGDRARPQRDGPLLELSPDHLLLVGARPASRGDGVLLQLREIAGRPATCRVRVPDGSPWTTVQRVSVLEDPLGDSGETPTLRPFEVVFLKLARSETLQADQQLSPPLPRNR